MALYYIIPAENCNAFVTDPTNPEMDKLIDVWHMVFPNPKNEASLVHFGVACQLSIVLAFMTDSMHLQIHYDSLMITASDPVESRAA